MGKEDSKNAQISKVASLYYEEGKTQLEIAEAVGTTRVSISRMLTEARGKGIVTIDVDYPWTSKELEQQLILAFGLKDAKVLYTENSEPDTIIEELGLVAARYFGKIVKEDSIIGISWGRALHKMIDFMKPQHLPKAKIVQLIGASGTETFLSDGPKLAQNFSEKLGCESMYMHAPLIVENEDIRSSLMQNHMISNTLEEAVKADIALVGIGAVVEGIYSLAKTGYVDSKELANLASQGAVGDICAQHFDISGNLLDLPINHRTIGITLDMLTKIKTVIGVAGDPRKSRAIYGALNGNYIDVLITDQHVAIDVLNMKKI